MGYTDERIFRASGMILRPTFYQPVTVDRAAERKRLGLDPDRPTGLVLFGGQGSKVMLEIAERLPDVQLILICGKKRGSPTASARCLLKRPVSRRVYVGDPLLHEPGRFLHRQARSGEYQ